MINARSQRRPRKAILTIAPKELSVSVPGIKAIPAVSQVRAAGSATTLVLPPAPSQVHSAVFASQGPAVVQPPQVLAAGSPSLVIPTLPSQELAVVSPTLVLPAVPAQVVPVVPSEALPRVPSQVIPPTSPSPLIVANTPSETLPGPSCVMTQQEVNFMLSVLGRI